MQSRVNREFWTVLAGLDGIFVERSDDDKFGIIQLLTKEPKAGYAVHHIKTTIPFDYSKLDPELLFFDYALSRGDDVNVGFTCDAEFEIFVGGNIVQKDDAVLVQAAQCERVWLRIYPRMGQCNITIEYDVIQMNYHLHYDLAKHVWITKGLVYKNGMTTNVGYYVGKPTLLVKEYVCPFVITGLKCHQCSKCN